MKKILFTIFLSLCYSLKCQNIEKVTNVRFQVSCNKYNTLYRGKTNELTIKYDTVKYKGEIIWDFDTSFKEVKKLNKYQYSFFIDEMGDTYYPNHSEDVKLNFLYKTNEKIEKIEKKSIVLVDTIAWVPKLICDNFYFNDGLVYRDKFLRYLLDLDYQPRMLYFIRNDQIINDYKNVDYCISGTFSATGEYFKNCTRELDTTENGFELIHSLSFMRALAPIYIENIEVTGLNGEKKYFPPMSFMFWPLHI